MVPRATQRGPGDAAPGRGWIPELPGKPVNHPTIQLEVVLVRLGAHLKPRATAVPFTVSDARHATRQAVGRGSTGPRPLGFAFFAGRYWDTR